MELKRSLFACIFRPFFIAPRNPDYRLQDNVSLFTARDTVFMIISHESEQAVASPMLGNFRLHKPGVNANIKIVRYGKASWSSGSRRK